MIKFIFSQQGKLPRSLTGCPLEDEVCRSPLFLAKKKAAHHEVVIMPRTKHGVCEPVDPKDKLHSGY